MSDSSELTGDTIFGKIIRREIPADIVYEDDYCLAFHDIQPVAPVHVLVIPKRYVKDISHCSDPELLGQLLNGVRSVAKLLGLDSYRVVVNNGAEVGQTVFHLHLHVLAGRAFTWPPG